MGAHRSRSPFAASVTGRLLRTAQLCPIAESALQSSFQVFGGVHHLRICEGGDTYLSMSQRYPEVFASGDPLVEDWSTLTQARGIQPELVSDFATGARPL
jgi:hypothetical protein